MWHALWMSTVRRVLFYGGGALFAVAGLTLGLRQRQRRQEEEALEEPMAYDETSAFTEGTGSSALFNDLAYMAGSVAAGIAAGNVLGAVGFGGDLSQTANEQLRPQTELLLEQYKMQKELERYTKGQDQLQGASDVVDTWFDGLDGAMEQGSVEQSVVQGITDTGASIVTASIEIAKLVDTTGTLRVADILNFGNEGTPEGIAAAAFQTSLLPAHMLTDALVGGLGGALADAIAQTPEQRAEADVILGYLNPSNLIENIRLIPPPPPIPEPPPRTDVVPTRDNPPPPPPPPRPRSPRKASNSKDKGGSKKVTCKLTARQRANGKKCQG
jgi:hypothetical protein